MYDPTKDYAPDIAFNEWISYIQNETTKAKKRLAQEKNKLAIHEVNSHCALRWETRIELNKPKSRYGHTPQKSSQV